MAARHPHDELHVAGYPGYNKCPRCFQYVRGQEPSRRHLRSQVCQQGRKRLAARMAEEELSQQLSNLPTFYIEGREIERVDTFTYLGRQLSSGDDDFHACLRNLSKAKKKWGALSRVLQQEGASKAYKSRVYLIVVSTVLLYGSETWVLNDRITQVLEAFHNRCARHITKRYIRRVAMDEDDTRWIYPSTEETLKAAKLRPVMDYITKRREVFYNTYLRFSPLFDASKTWTTAGHVRTFPRYHKQQFSLDAENT